ncbi:hypothetical protein YUYDRAFT_02074 [Streptomyces sp. ScaeMP-e48]|uniref:hypothetical protein n=1 Tax=Streptomyces sp. ScaeMP-e48 TaxID=1100823 RepID=UPI000823D72A|nr:hypothetical protein [Streptomyces sp. ScaeMP-e48]SCK20044.1 hypothetical protein YUYDRAFT_02074 [Streptomyces sp. ScaeMP-e48]
MPILAGQIVTASQLNRLQPKKYGAVGSGTIAGAATNADVPSATVTVDTETAANYVVWCVWDANVSAASTGTLLGRLNLDGVNQSPLATMNQPTSAGRAQPSQQYIGTLSAAGSHTFKLVASPMASQTVQGVNCSLIVEITEVV